MYNYARYCKGVDGRSGGELPTRSVGLPSAVREQRGGAVVEHLPQPCQCALHLLVATLAISSIHSLLNSFLISECD